MKIKLLYSLMFLFAATSLLSACGKDGDPVLPPGKTDDFKKKYPTTTDPQTGVFN